MAVTGVSGSGKSSLAFDTIYAEGQRRYVRKDDLLPEQTGEHLGYTDEGLNFVLNSLKLGIKKHIEE